MTIDWPFIWRQANAIVALLVALLIALTSIPVRVWIGNYTLVGRSEVIVNLVLLVVLINSRGNITGKR